MLKLINITAFLSFSSLAEGKHLQYLVVVFGFFFTLLATYRRENRKEKSPKYVRDRDFILFFTGMAYLCYFSSCNSCVLAFGIVCISSALPVSYLVCME